VRLRSDFWVAAYMRRCAVEGAYAVQRRRGSPEAGAIYVKLDRLDGQFAVYGPAPADPDGLRSDERRFVRLHEVEFLDGADAESRLQRQLRFDPDIWLIEVEDRNGRHFLDLAE